MRLLTDYGEAPQKPQPTAQAARKRITLSIAFQQVRSCAPTKPIVAAIEASLSQDNSVKRLREGLRLPYKLKINAHH